ncbi:hypothetical protein PSTG_19341, partial [Puccinia striiformis f. sp. tritici PST-78]
LPTAQWNAIVEECYETYFTPKARSNAASKDSPKLSNTLLQLHDFSTVVEAKRAMKAGDIGRVMIVWKKWCLMAQALSGITNYSSYLPRMVKATISLPTTNGLRSKTTGFSFYTPNMAQACKLKDSRNFSL